MELMPLHEQSGDRVVKILPQGQWRIEEVPGDNGIQVPCIDVRILVDGHDIGNDMLT